ncbi:MAG: acyl-CoA-binding protein [Caldilineaceae bacterium]|nr:acyl-CoA-binding protein [Caldilineaceae bacterium]MCB9139323.1 acyl-CoA-binding protein [Caldilineaceae bacterium]
MSDLQSRFEAAAAAAQQLPSKPDNETLLQLYALYKQATQGDAGGKQPGRFDLVGRAKYDAWNKLRGTSQDDARETYVSLVEELQGKGV